MESRDWDRAAATARAAEHAYARAGVTAASVDAAEVDDTFAYKQLQHLDALGLQGLDPARVNRSGGAIGEGHLHEANGLARALACVEQLRAGEAIDRRRAVLARRAQQQRRRRGPAPRSRLRWRDGSR